MKKRIVSAFLVLCLCGSMFSQVEVEAANKVVEKAKQETKKASEAADDAKKDAKKAAENLENAEKEGKQLEKDKAAAKKKIEELRKSLNKILDEIDEIQKKITAKREEIGEKEQELFAAQVDENSQYEAMKKRIKYMYENGNKKFVEIVMESEDFSDMLNKVEYVSTISSYDRDMLTKFQNIRIKVQEQKDALDAEYEELDQMQDQIVAKQKEAENMIEEKKDEISSLETEIASNEKEQQKLEAAKAAAEEVAAKKAEAAEAAKAAEIAAKTAAAEGAGAPVISGNGTFTHPCPGLTRISSYFGPRKAPKAGASTNHKGMDFAAPTGTPIYAAAAGTVVSACYSGNAGNLVIINHGNGLSTYYMHTSKMFVKAGQKVTKGQNIAAVGTTGNSTGPHLHFQVMLNGVAVNPMGYL